MNLNDLNSGKRNWKKEIAASAIVAAASAGGGLLTYGLYGNTAQVVELLAGAAALAGSSKLLFDHNDGHGFKEGLGTAAGWLAIGSADAGVAGWSGGGAHSLWAWLGAMGAGCALRFAWGEHRAERWLDRSHRVTRINNTAGQARLAELREEMALLKLKQTYAKMAPAEVVNTTPVFAGGLSGDLQRAVWVASGQKVVIEPPLVMSEDHGWTAELELKGSGWSQKKLEQNKQVVGQEVGGLRRALEVLPSDSEGVARLRYREPGEWPSEVPFRASFLGQQWDAPIQVGVDEWGGLIELVLNIHSITAGATNFGKSTIINSIIVQLASREHVVVVGVDMKPFAPEFTPLKPILGKLLTTLEEAHEWADWLTNEMYERGEIMAREGVKKWDPTKPWAKGRPVIHTFFDEYAEAIRQELALGTRKGERIQEKVETVLAMARAYGLYLHLCTQQPSAKMFGDDTGPRGNCPIRIAFHMSEANHDRYVLSSGWATKILGGQAGRFVMMSPAHREPQPYMGYWLPDGELAAVVSALADMREELPVNMTKSVTLSYEEMEEKVEEVARLTRSQAAETILLELAMGPATRGSLKASLGGQVTDNTVKDALKYLKVNNKAVYDTELEAWRLI